MVLTVTYLYLFVILLQMFLFNKIEKDDIDVAHFDVTGTTYTPEGDV